MVDCNDCRHLNITENEQKDKGMPHICMFYRTRVFHRTQQRFHRGYLYPCDECVKDNYENFEIREQKGVVEDGVPEVL